MKAYLEIVELKNDVVTASGGSDCGEYIPGINCGIECGGELEY